ncbi:unnamed protein product [Gadus morhua 'NCC']
MFPRQPSKHAPGSSLRCLDSPFPAEVENWASAVELEHSLGTREGRLKKTKGLTWLNEGEGPEGRTDPARKGAEGRRKTEPFLRHRGGCLTEEVFLTFVVIGNITFFNIIS